ncbi:hypothetical protein [Sphingomonas aerolata]
MTFSPGVLPNAYPTLATIACGDRAFCRFMAWADKTKAATSTPLTPAQSAAITFSYLRDRSADYEKALWNCQQVRRPDPTQCMRARQTLRAAPAAADKAAPPADAPQELDGVRRKTPATPAATAAPMLKPDVRKAPQATEM